MINIYELPVPSIAKELRPVGDLVANGIVLATLLNWLPVMAAVVSLIWGAMRCYETYLDIRKKQITSSLPVSVKTVTIEAPLTEKTNGHTPVAAPIATGVIAVEVVTKKENTDAR